MCGIFYNSHSCFTLLASIYPLFLDANKVKKNECGYHHNLYYKKAPNIGAFEMFPATSYSPTLVSRAVPSALKGLTAEFGMGSGVSPTL